MSKRRLGWWSVLSGVGVGAPLLVLGCGDGNVSAGAEGDTINLARCFGADCSVSVQASEGAGSAAEPCGGVEGTLQDAVRFDATPGVQWLSLRVAPDGAVWVSGKDTTTDLSAPEPVLMRYSADGELLGETRVEGLMPHNTAELALAVDPAGHALLGIYTLFAPNADSELTERFNVYTFDEDLALVGEPLAFGGLAETQLLAASETTLVLAGNAQNNARRGVVARLTEREPDWIQTNVPAAGTSRIGVRGVVAAESGHITVLAQRHATSDHDEYGLTTFDSEGAPVWDLKLPTEYKDGWPAALSITSQGDFVVAAVLDAQTVRVQRVSRQGVVGWAFDVPKQEDWQYLTVDEADRVYVGSDEGFAVIDPAGERCYQLATLPLAEYPDYPVVSDEVVVRGEYLYMTTPASEILRYRLPTE
jgi:hypothetical protein